MDNEGGLSQYIAWVMLAGHHNTGDHIFRHHILPNYGSAALGDYTNDIAW